MSPSGRRIGAAVGRAVRRVRAEGALAAGLVVVAIAPLLLVLAALVGPAAWGARGAAPLVAVGVGVLAAAALLVQLGRRWVSAVDPAAVAAAAERREGLAAGTLRGALELAREMSPGGSAALFRRTELELEGRIVGSTPTTLSGELVPGSGWYETRTASFVSESNRRTPRSVIIASGPPRTSPTRSRQLPPSP